MYCFKIIATVVVLSVIVNVEAQNVTALSQNVHQASVTRPDDYINSNRRYYANNIEDYDRKMNNFRKSYTERLDSINTQLDMLLDALDQTDQRLNALELLSDSSKECVRKYRSPIPTSTSTKSSIGSCVTTANNNLNSLLSSPLATRNNLQSYYTNTYDRGLTNCETKFKDLPLNYTLCITSLTTSANSYTVSNQKTFATQMDAAECSAKANIKKALDCSFNIQNRTISLMAEANALINKCLSGESDCQSCAQGHICSDVYYINRQEIDTRNRTMENVFFSRDISNSTCLMLQLDDGLMS